MHKNCSFVKTEDTDAIYTALFLQNICSLRLAQILWIIHHNHFNQLVLNKSGKSLQYVENDINNYTTA